MGISDGLGTLFPPRGGQPNHPNPRERNRNPVVLEFTPGEDILTGRRNRTIHYVLKNRNDALISQSDAITNFKKQDKAFLPGVQGKLTKAVLTLRYSQVALLQDPEQTNFINPNDVVGIRIKDRKGQRVLGTYIVANDARPGLQMDGDAAFFLGNYNLNRSHPFHYHDSLLL